MLRHAVIQMMVGVVSTALILVACSSAGQPATPTSTSRPTPGPATATPPPEATAEPQDSTLVRVMRRFPSSTKEQGFWFGDVARALDLAGIEKVDSLQDFLALGGEAVMRYQNALRGVPQPAVVLTGGPGNVAFGQLFGFDAFTPELAAGIGEISTERNQVVYMEGGFDSKEIRAALVSLGYQVEERSGITYFVLGQDFAVQDKKDGSVGEVAFNRMNRVAVLSDAVVVAPSTKLVVDVLKAVVGDEPSLATDPTFGAIADALGDPIGAVLLTREQSVFLLGMPPPYVDEFGIPDDWVGLHEWIAMGFGFREEDGQKFWRLAMHYVDPGVAYLDGDEIVRRMLGYASLVPGMETTGRRLFEESCGEIDWSHRDLVSGSVLVVECKLTASAPVAWPFLVNERDMAFLLN